MTNIVVACDGSEHAQKALGWARELARSVPEPVLHLVHAYHVPVPISEGMALEYARTLQEVREEGQELLDRMAASLEGVSVRTHLRQGAAAPAVLSVAHEVGADLIAMGSRGLGRAASLFLGSVSTEVVHHARVPVLVARHDQARSLRRVLVGVDGSAHSARALAFAVRWAPEAEITALHVLHLAPEARALFEQTDLSFDVALDRTARDVVSRTAELARVPADRVRPLAATGSAAEQLLAEYRTGGYDLAVVGSRGLGLLGELFLGSVSERLLRLAPGPVVVVK